MTVKRARKLLGEKFRDASDEEIKQQISILRSVATSLVEKIMEIDYSSFENEASNNSSKSLIS